MGLKETGEQAPAEEYFESEATGVELETDTAPEPQITKPWDPDAIRVDSKAFALRNILDMIHAGDLEIAPDFQRLRVWKTVQKSQLIESILLQIPLPAFYFTEEKDGMMRVVDGLQRLSAIDEFVQQQSDGHGFNLRGLEYLKEIEGHRFEQLAPSWRRRILNSQIFVHVIDPQTPDSVKFDIFKRINTGGSPLNAQEIRHCMSGARSRSFLKTLSSLDSFERATGGALRAHVRMVDREVALRFCAFEPLRDPDDFSQYQTMDGFLTDATRSIDYSRSDEELRQLSEAFDSAMEKAYAVFGENAFRKWPLSAVSRSPINRALFETWSVVLSRYPLGGLIDAREQITQMAREMMTNDYDYLDAITYSTADPRRVILRFARAQALVESCLGA